MASKVVRKGKSLSLAPLSQIHLIKSEVPTKLIAYFKEAHMVSDWKCWMESKVMKHSSPAQQNALMSQPNTTAGVQQLEEIEFHVFIQITLESHLSKCAYLGKRRRILFKCQERGGWYNEGNTFTFKMASHISRKVNHVRVLVSGWPKQNWDKP